MDANTIRARLNALAEPEYRAFAGGLMPGVESVLGVRAPHLRRMAKEIARGDWQAYLKTAADDSYEETLLQGMVIGCANAPLQERLLHVRTFVEKIDNWSTCDSFCSGLKCTNAHPEAVWAFLQPYLVETRAYPLRFGIVMLCFYFIDEAHIDPVLTAIESVRHDAYYVRMAVAWALSICFVKFPERTMALLCTSGQEDWTYNKALQKIVESRQVDAGTKALIKSMKRKAVR